MKTSLIHPTWDPLLKSTWYIPFWSFLHRIVGSVYEVST